jgi:FAD synthetase
MAEVLRWLKSAASTPVGQLAARSLDVIDSALHVYSPDEVCFSFNGGKDSTVVFHMLRAACLRRAQADASVDEAGAEAAATALLQRVRMVYFEVEDNFPEVESFMKDTCDRYALRMQRLPPFKTGLMQLIADHGIRAVLIGTRATDPDGSEYSAARALTAWGFARNA